ncbi:hypothetical protein [Chryseobacterium sp.]|uniref:hypothetical protein n=1 Tax=Chryseobacterium sp. TaxID=1871047 RepID=UPI0025C36AB8|nr:hypothetical protein [Chryseobacterium sp.]MBV8328287.1 hypothetical protein [Chryseobacterium sp.]
MTATKIKEFIISISENLEKEYKTSPGKPWLTLAGSTILVTFLGMFYLWVYFDQYQMIGFAALEVNDAYSLLFNNLMPMIYVALILSFFLLILVPGIIKNNLRNTTGAKLSGEVIGQEGSMGLSNMAVIIIILIIHAGLYVLLQVYEFGALPTIVFLSGAALASYLYLKIANRAGIALAVLMCFFYAHVRAIRDVKLNEKIKPKVNLVLSSLKDPILTERNRCRYIIYNTSSFYYIKDSCEKKIYAFSTSTGEWKSKTVK